MFKKILKKILEANKKSEISDKRCKIKNLLYEMRRYIRREDTKSNGLTLIEVGAGVVGFIGGYEVFNYCGRIFIEDLPCEVLDYIIDNLIQIKQYAEMVELKEKEETIENILKIVNEK